MRHSLMTLLMLAAPRAALACPVCFGESDSPLAKAANLGIFAMLIVVAGVLGAFASFFIYLMRRARLVAALEAARAADGSGPATAEQYDGPREGTAPC